MLLTQRWKLWKEQGFTSLPPRRYLREAKNHAGLEVGDACILNHNNSVCGTYRVYRVLSIQEHTGDQARKVKVSYNECRAGETYKYVPRRVIVINVQRLALLVPVAEMELQEEPD